VSILLEVALVDPERKSFDNVAIEAYNDQLVIIHILCDF